MPRTIDVHDRMVELNLEAECSGRAFLDVAEPDFSPALRAGVGAAIYDGNPVASYQEWLDDVARTLRIMDPA